MHYHFDGDNRPVPTTVRREHFIPLQPTDLVDYLSQHPALTTAQQTSFRQLASLILSLLHHLYRQRHEQLTYIYAPLDPDRDRLLRTIPTGAARRRLCEELLERTRDALGRANYHRLSLQAIETALRAASQWGVRMRVNFEALETVEVYVRGNIIGHREVRRWTSLYRRKKVDVPLYQRLVVVFRPLEDSASGQFDARHVYLRMFKNVPQQDVDMMLPATAIHMSWLDHSRIVLPSLYAAGMTLWRVLRNVAVLALLGVFKTIGFLLLVLFAAGFGIKSMFTYRSNTKRRYLLSMAQSLYYQNLDNNGGVLLRLLDEGEQQEACEAVLVYFVSAILHAEHASGSLTTLDQACEAVLLEATGAEIDFDVESTVRMLVHLGIMRMDAQGWRALPLDAAMTKLDHTWDRWFGM